MKRMTSAEVRQSFLDFFEEMGHKHVDSSSLVPANDPTLLFANSGMVQFKDVFLGLDKRPYKRATTAQKCMRVSGKHNDLENVGPSARHHTFFEMLGNFSFGDYFKSNAIRYAYDVLTKVYGLPPEQLYYTVHNDDQDAYNIWVNEIGVPADRVYKLGDKTNFWQMADTGPCGYTSEIHFDWSPELGNDPQAVLAELDDSTGRILEIWNLVFMQFNQHKDGTREPLPAPSIDTGMGFERITAILQGVRNNYQSDLFTPIIAKIRSLNGATHEQYQNDYVPYHVIADHVRAACFLIADGVNPGPKDRGSICRLVIRRAARFGRRIGFTDPFLSQVAETVIAEMGGYYKELTDRREVILKQIHQEEVRFGRTLERGLEALNDLLTGLQSQGQTVVPGEQAFFLKSSLGLPLEVIKDVAQEAGYSVDEAGYDTAEQEHSRVSGDTVLGRIDLSELYKSLVEDLKDADLIDANGVAYDPYHELEHESHVVAIIRDGALVESAEVGDRVEVILRATPFYVESGGQVSDTGTISGTGTGGDGWTLDVDEMKKPVGGLIVHVGEVVEGTLTRGAAVAQVDEDRRLNITRNHTATHLLHAQLRNTLGTHVQQKGSLVAPDRLRFDFSHDSAITPSELSAVTGKVSEMVMDNFPVANVEKDLASAREEGAMALFGEKYGDRVRTVKIGTQGTDLYSYELCGGTHVPATAVIGNFVITSEGSVSQGVRRIEALTGKAAAEYIGSQLDLLRATAQQIGVPADQIVARMEQVREEAKAARAELAKVRLQMAKMEFDNLLNKTEWIADVPVLITEVAPTSAETLREMTNWFRDKMGGGVIVLGTVENGKPNVIAAVSDDLTKRVQAGSITKQIAPIMGGGGGGRPNMAQAGGKDPQKLAEALTAARTAVHTALG